MFRNLKPDDRTGHRPDCYDRPPWLGYWATTPAVATGKPRLRWLPHRMSQTCGAWAADTGHGPVPVVEGWDCSGCRWRPTKNSRGNDG